MSRGFYYKTASELGPRASDTPLAIGFLPAPLPQTIVSFNLPMCVIFPLHHKSLHPHCDQVVF